MSAIRNVRLFALVLSAAAAFAAAAPAQAAARDTYAAIAYAPSTGSIGYSWHASSRAEAQLDALAQCHGADAQILVWVKNGYAAMAVGQDGSYGYAWASSQEDAERLALQKCLEVGGVRPHIQVSIYSAD